MRLVCTSVLRAAVAPTPFPVYAVGMHWYLFIGVRAPRAGLAAAFLLMPLGLASKPSQHDGTS